LKDGSKKYSWSVSNPINNYGVNINIEIMFLRKYKGEKGDLDCTYYVLRDNLAKPKNNLKMSHACCRLWALVWTLSFYEDSYKLVEAPYLGMEHQSSVTYGNGLRMAIVAEIWVVLAGD
jgi:hypothetical protein